MTSWEKVKSQDRLAFAAAASPGTTMSTSASSSFYDGCIGAREHCAHFDIEHLQCTAHVYAEAGLYWGDVGFTGPRGAMLSPSTSA